MAKLTEAQAKAIARIDRTGKIEPGDRELLPLLHWCPDWDYLPVCVDSPEIDGCRCSFEPTTIAIGATTPEGEPR